ncbi:hypothetical protein TRFO_25320 [Tritrichomonas foetus]|uniref:Uncharacterized protein n=1 Tax=Tritrichomonas foetus TaxID=1144522 RepID=A0A1J4KA91_9EUKA|nr:hypothetical protein TRFO_25320 [Tritrichomonas foetus]|eukprot:OHT06582.1 hypothetical protein TRFO_25320 [Tritrichomonas foetus]
MFSKKQTDDEKVVKYLNAFNHFTLDPKVANIHPNGKKWAHSNNITARTCLWNLLVETSDIIRTHHRCITTNKNENFHSIKARLLPKLYNWGSGWIGRICSAILQNNLPGIWMIYALSALNIPLPAIHTFLAYLHRVIQRKEIFRIRN